MAVLTMRRDVMARQLRLLREAVRPDGVVFPVKCNPHPAVLEELAGLGCGFEVASFGELLLLREASIDTSGVIFGAPFRSVQAIEDSLDLGTDTFVVDSVTELEKFAKWVPDVKILIRLVADSAGSLFPLSGKFGAGPDEVVRIGARAADLGVRISGLTFHVGSQAEGLSSWRQSMRTSAGLWNQLTADGHELEILDIGGGFPVQYATVVPAIEDIGEAIRSELEDRFPQRPRLVCEPGRYLVAEAGTMQTEIVGTAQRGGHRWLFLDVGVFNGLIETFQGGSGISYPITLPDGDPGESVTLAGASCDGTDIIQHDVTVPSELQSGDNLLIENTGAYTTAYAATFCGYPPPEIRIQ